MANRKVVDLSLADSTDIQSSNAVLYLVNPDRALDSDKDRKLPALANVVFTSEDQTIGGNKTFSNTITGSITGNAGTVTDGVYTSRQVIAGTGLAGGGALSSDVTLSIGTGIDAASIADGSVSNTEFQYLNGVTSALQTQLDGKLSLSGGTMTGNIALGSNNITTSSGSDIGFTRLSYQNSASTLMQIDSGRWKIYVNNYPVYEANDAYQDRTSSLTTFDTVMYTYKSRYPFYGAAPATTTDQVQFKAGGAVLSRQGIFTSISSDERLKQDIRDANSQWDDVRNIRVINYRFIKEVEHLGDDASTLIGFSAQQLENAGMNGLVMQGGSSDDNNDDVAYKTVKQSIIFIKAIKALQEAMERIEVLESRLEALGG